MKNLGQDKKKKLHQWVDSPKPGIGRRTGKPLNIKQIKGSGGFDDVDGYFPDSDPWESSESENEEEPTLEEDSQLVSEEGDNLPVNEESIEDESNNEDESNQDVELNIDHDSNRDDDMEEELSVSEEELIAEVRKDDAIIDEYFNAEVFGLQVDDQDDSTTQDDENLQNGPGQLKSSAARKQSRDSSPYIKEQHQQSSRKSTSNNRRSSLRSERQLPDRRSPNIQAQDNKVGKKDRRSVSQQSEQPQESGQSPSIRRLSSRSNRRASLSDQQQQPQSPKYHRQVINASSSSVQPQQAQQTTPTLSNQTVSRHMATGTEDIDHVWKTSNVTVATNTSDIRLTPSYSPKKSVGVSDRFIVTERRGGFARKKTRAGRNKRHRAEEFQIDDDYHGRERMGAKRLRRHRREQETESSEDLTDEDQESDFEGNAATRAKTRITGRSKRRIQAKSHRKPNTRQLRNLRQAQSEKVNPRNVRETSRRQKQNKQGLVVEKENAPIVNESEVHPPSKSNLSARKRVLVTATQFVSPQKSPTENPVFEESSDDDDDASKRYNRLESLRAISPAKQVASPRRSTNRRDMGLAEPEISLCYEDVCHDETDIPGILSRSRKRPRKSVQFADIATTNDTGHGGYAEAASTPVSRNSYSSTVTQRRSIPRIQTPYSQKQSTISDKNDGTNVSIRGSSAHTSEETEEDTKHPAQSPKKKHRRSKLNYNTKKRSTPVKRKSIPASMKSPSESPQKRITPTKMKDAHVSMSSQTSQDGANSQEESPKKKMRSSMLNYQATNLSKRTLMNTTNDVNSADRGNPKALSPPRLDSEEEAQELVKKKSSSSKLNYKASASRKSTRMNTANVKNSEDRGSLKDPRNISCRKALSPLNHNSDEHEPIKKQRRPSKLNYKASTSRKSTRSRAKIRETVSARSAERDHQKNDQMKASNEEDQQSSSSACLKSPTPRSILRKGRVDSTPKSTSQSARRISVANTPVSPEPLTRWIGPSRVSLSTSRPDFLIAPVPNTPFTPTKSPSHRIAIEKSVSHSPVPSNSHQQKSLATLTESDDVHEDIELRLETSLFEHNTLPGRSDSDTPLPPIPVKSKPGISSQALKPKKQRRQQSNPPQKKKIAKKNDGGLKISESKIQRTYDVHEEIEHGLKRSLLEHNTLPGRSDSDTPLPPQPVNSKPGKHSQAQKPKRRRRQQLNPPQRKKPVKKNIGGSDLKNNRLPGRSDSDTSLSPQLVSSKPGKPTQAPKPKKQKSNPSQKKEIAKKNVVRSKIPESKTPRISKKPAGPKEKGEMQMPNDSSSQSDDYIMEEIDSMALVKGIDGKLQSIPIWMTPSMLQMKVLGENQNISYDKCFGTDQYNMGHLFLQPGADKGYQLAKNCSFNYFIYQGCLDVTVEETTMRLVKNCQFFVPTNNNYKMKNIGNSVAKLLFVQAS